MISLFDFVLGQFQWYRRMRGGKWGVYTGYLWGYRWTWMPPHAIGWDEWWANQGGNK